MVLCTGKLNATISVSHKQVITRSMKRFIKQAFLADVSSICWEQIVHNTDDIHTMVREWSSIFSAIIEKHAPIRKTRISDKNSPWVNNELKSLMKLRYKLKKDAVKHKSQAMMGCYKEVRSKVNSLNILFIYKISNISDHIMPKIS